jgi:hypothetical protein
MHAQAESSSTTAPAPRLASRRLVGLEHAMCITEEHIPFHVVAVLRVEGDLPAETVRGALDALQRRHPLLRARILREAGGYAFHFDSAGPIPLEARDRPQGDGWVAAAQEESHRPLDIGTGPLARCLYLVDGRGGDLILSIHHTIVDAASAVHFLGELLALCAGQAPEMEGDPAEEGQVAPTALYPDEYKGLGFARALGAFMARQAADEIGFRWGSRGVRTPPISDSGRCLMLPVRFPAALSQALEKASRRRRITLNAILSAGLMTAVQRHLYPMSRVPARVPLRHLIFADLRARLRTRVPDARLGCMLSMFRFAVLVGGKGGFWALAWDIQEATRRGARTGERFLAYAMSPRLMKLIFDRKPFRMAATALSYSGPLNLPTSWGRFELAGVHAFAPNMTVGPEYHALVRLFRGELWWDIGYMDCDMEEAAARRIAEETRAVLEEAVC